jgi:hypothetical protein
MLTTMTFAAGDEGWRVDTSSDAGNAKRHARRNLRTLSL